MMKMKTSLFIEYTSVLMSPRRKGKASPNFFSKILLDIHRGNAKSRLEAVVEHRVGSQVHEMILSDQKVWSQDPPLPRSHLRVGSGGEHILLVLLSTWGLWKVSRTFLFVFVSIAVGFVLSCCSLELCYRCCWWKFIADSGDCVENQCFVAEDLLYWTVCFWYLL